MSDFWALILIICGLGIGVVLSIIIFFHFTKNEYKNIINKEKKNSEDETIS